jgi:MHS family proline/betaine transporter-like MFS transporter
VILIVIATSLMAVGAGAGAALMMKACPRKHRATGMSLMYSLGVTLFGGFSPRS